MQDLNERVLASLEKVRSDIRERLNVSDFVSEGVLDSLDIMNVIMTLEDDFSIEIDPEEVITDNFASLNSIAKMVSEHLSGGNDRWKI
ncbi:MAG: acyl carrier protein, partial [Eubacterium sp.]|nr:acyl carrier protein [Eubacterium sp.]